MLIICLMPPSSQFWLGTDDLARDIWSQTIYGSRISLTIGFVAALITVVSGTFIGAYRRILREVAG